jgi:DNA-binding NtrC family response regulator
LKVGEVPRLASDAIAPLMSYHWPGNVRELENVVERAMILHRGEPLRFDDLGSPFQDDAQAGTTPLKLDTVIKQHIRSVLDMTGGKVHGPGGAAEILGVNANTLRYRMEKLGIRFGRQKGTR